MCLFVFLWVFFFFGGGGGGVLVCCFLKNGSCWKVEVVEEWIEAEGYTLLKVQVVKG